MTQGLSLDPMEPKRKITSSFVVVVLLLLPLLQTTSTLVGGFAWFRPNSSDRGDGQPQVVVGWSDSVV
jgi:hypothetical protein